MKLTALLLLCAAAVFSAGCASNKQFVRIPDLNQRVEDPTRGRIYVIRPSSTSAGSSMEVWDGTAHIGNTGAKSFLCWERQPGKAQISGREENVSIVDLDVQTNQVYYVFQHIRIGWVQARNKMEVISAEEGQKLLKRCKAPSPAKCEDHSECRTTSTK